MRALPALAFSAARGPGRFEFFRGVFVVRGRLLRIALVGQLGGELGLFGLLRLVGHVRLVRCGDRGLVQRLLLPLEFREDIVDGEIAFGEKLILIPVSFVHIYTCLSQEEGNDRILSVICSPGSAGAGSRTS